MRVVCVFSFLGSFLGSFKACPESIAFLSISLRCFVFFFPAGCTGSRERTFKRNRREIKDAVEIFVNFIFVFRKLYQSIKDINMKALYCLVLIGSYLNCDERFTNFSWCDTYTLTELGCQLQRFYFTYLFCLFLVLLILSVICDKPPSTCGQTACPHYTRPVCATNGRVRRTFNNQCAVRTFNECSSDESE